MCPFYDIQCSKCQYHEEQLISIEQSEKRVKCPECGKRTFRKVFKKAADFVWGKNCSLAGVYDRSRRLSKSRTKEGFTE
jgi:putative FmdB family regulatory protein